MKILLIHTFYSPDMVGGAEVVVQSLAEGLMERGIDVAILTTTDKPGLHQDEVNGIRVWRAGLRNLYWHKYSEPPGAIKRRLWHIFDVYNPLMSQFVKKVVSFERPTVASVHNLPGFSLSAWSALKDSGVPIVQVLHDHYLLCPAGTMYKNQQICTTQCSTCRLMRLPHKAMSQNVSGVTGVSNYILHRHLDAGYFQGVTNRRVIYNTRTMQEIGVPVRHEIETDSNRPLRFGFIGALHSVKGIELLLKTYAENAFPGSDLWVAGAGETGYVDKLKRMAEGYPVHFLGRVTPAEFYSQVDVVIVPSLWNEPLGTVIMEAMIYGKVIIASNTGGTPEMIIDGENGLLFNPEKPNGLLEVMVQISASPVLLEHLAEGADRCRARFMDRDHFLDEHISICMEVEHYG
jgi:glycosyltransferase involved in cell wall biosynthesis